MKKFFYLIIFLPFITMLFVHCAQEGQLTGGPKDTIPPKILKIKPQLPDTAIQKNKISIKFNEFVQLNNIQQNFFCSPPLPDKPNFKIRGKKIILTLPYPLKDSTTYYIVFKDAIQDYAEKNTLKKLELVFSTYNQIDTLQCAGYVTNAFTDKPEVNLTVVAYNFDDSLFWKHFPLYAAITDSNGKFTFKYLKKGKYRIFAFNDMNSNYIFDGYPENIVGFSEKPIIPYTSIDTLIDSLKAGTVIFKDTIADTLKKDTVIISYKTRFMPDSLQLYTFEISPDTISIKRSARLLKCLLAIYFTAPIPNNYLKLYGIPNNKFFVEKFKSKDSIYIWLTDSSLYNKDTLKFTAEYFINQKKSKKTDTITFSDIDNFSDTLPLTIKLKQKKILPDKKLILNSELPLKKINTDKINLFAILDTNVTKDLKQSFKILRPEYDTLIINFERPLIKKLKIDFDNITDDSLHYTTQYDSSQKNIIVTLIDTTLINQDTLKFSLHYDNLYFFDVIQNLESKVKIPVLKQKYNIIRPENKKIIITLSKNIKIKPEINPLNFSKKDFSIAWTGDSLIINLTKQFNDTLIFAIKIYDKRKIDGTAIFINDTIRSFYQYKGNPLLKAERYAKHKVRLIFAHNLIFNPTVKILNFKPFRKWYKLKYLRGNRDTAYILITNNRVKRLKKLDLALNWKDISPEGDTITMQDTLNLQVKFDNTNKNNKQNILTNDSKSIHLTLKKPVDFTISLDSLTQKEISLTSDFSKSNKFYLHVDSAAFTSICGNSNDSLSFNFETEKLSSLLNPVFIFKHTAISNDTTDTIRFVAKGQIIMNLYDSEDNKIFSCTFDKDTTIKSIPIQQGTYNSVFIFDKDKNGIQTNGSLRKQRQPEIMKTYNLQIQQDSIEIDFLKLTNK